MLPSCIDSDTPASGNDEFWREIEKEAREGGDEKDRERARALDPLAQAARRDGAARAQIWRAARHAQTDDDLGRWRIVIAYERASMPTEKRRQEATPAEKTAHALSIDAGRRRIAAAYRAAIDACADQAPELFLELSDWAEQCHAEDLARPEAIPGGADTDCPEDEALIASPFSLEDESPLFQAAPHGPDAAVHILGEAAKTCSTSVLAAAAHAAALERLGRPAEAEAALGGVSRQRIEDRRPRGEGGRTLRGTVGFARAPLPPPPRQGGGARRLRAHGRPAESQENRRADLRGPCCCGIEGK